MRLQRIIRFIPVFPFPFRWKIVGGKVFFTKIHENLRNVYRICLEIRDDWVNFNSLYRPVSVSSRSITVLLSCV